MPTLKIGRLRFSVENVQRNVADQSQRVIHTDFGIKGKQKLDKDTGLPTVIERNFWQKFLPKSKQTSKKTVYSINGQKLEESSYKGKVRTSYTRYNDKGVVIESETIDPKTSIRTHKKFCDTTGQKLEESTYKGKVRTSYTKYNDKGVVIESETIDPKTLKKTHKKLLADGRYRIEMYKGNRLIYEEFPGTLSWMDSPQRYLFNPKEEKFACWISRSYDRHGDISKTWYEVPYMDAQGVKKSYIKYTKEGEDMTEFNLDGSIKSQITYRRTFDEYHSYKKNPYFETYTHTDANGNEIGKIQFNCGGQLQKYRTIYTDNGYIEEYADYLLLRLKKKKWVYKDGSEKEHIIYFKSSVEEVKIKNLDGSKSYQRNREGIETEFHTYDKDGHITYKREYDPDKKIKTEEFYGYGNIGGGIKGPILYRVHVTKNINGRDETRYFDGRHQRINPDGSYYQYSSENERMSEWFKQEKRTSNSGGNGGRSKTSGNSRTHTTSAGANESRTDFISRMNAFLTKGGRKILNDSDLNTLAKILGVEEKDTPLLKQFGDKNNRAAQKLYKNLCIKFHPDRNVNTQESQAIFQIIQGLRTL